MRLLLFFLFLAQAATVSAKEYECPATLSVEKTTIAPAGWDSFSNSTPHILERVGFYSGNPNEGASLVPDDNINKRDGSRDEWRFVITKDETIWIACFYTKTDIFLAKQLNPIVTKCSVEYKTIASGTRISVKNIICS